MTHSDDKGLVLPPKITPIHVVIIPIKPEDKSLITEAERLKNILSEMKVKIDYRDNLRPGEKYYEWERKGIPLRIEIGLRDLKEKRVVIVRRDTGLKENCPTDFLKQKIDNLLKEIQNNLFNSALERRQKSNQSADNWKEFCIAIKQGGYVFAHWCGEKTCENEMKEKVKAVSRCLPFDGAEEKGEHFCILCGKKTTYKKRWIFAKAY